MSEELVERRSLKDLEAVLEAGRKQSMKLVIIGGCAVAAYTRGYRHTKDIDLVADKPTLGKLRGLLKSLSYSIRDTEFGIASSKRLNGGVIDLHISVEKVYDQSTGNEYRLVPLCSGMRSASRSEDTFPRILRLRLLWPIWRL